ncbi:MAG: urocanate hydratase [Flavobacteriales bacterium]|nr:urocanate hydratase [Flavobacteriales bacterium]
MKDFQKNIKQGIPDKLPTPKVYDENISHAPSRKDILSLSEKKQAVINALRYFPEKFHDELAPEFAEELKKFGRIYMYRFRPDYEIKSRHIDEYPHNSTEAAAIMMMISNNLSNEIAQHPHELITYGGNGAVFQNWAQYLLCMKYLSTMNDNQTLVLYSGHPLGLFPSSKRSPRVVITNGMMIPNYSSKDHLEKFNALGVTQYGQMTAGSFMYIGPQGIVHGTTITILNAARKIDKKCENLSGKIFVTSGLGGMSGAQAKAGVIAKGISIVAEINPIVVEKRFKQGWVDKVFEDTNTLLDFAINARKNKEAVSIAFLGNIVELWEKINERNINIDIGSDQTSLHNPFSGGYYPIGLSFEESNNMIRKDPINFKFHVEKSLKRHTNAINKLSEKGMYFFDYGNAFLLESSRAGANILNKNSEFKYPSYVQDIMGPMCFDYGFGPFRWICASNNKKDLKKSDEIACGILEEILINAPDEIKLQLQDNIQWIKHAEENKMVVGSQSRILYADSEGRIKIAKAFNKAISTGEISAPIILGRDHHDVSGTDSPYRETSNIYDGSKFTADMAIHNVIGDSFRGATWVSIHNGGGVGWGEVINGGFGMVIDGSDETYEKIESMLFWDVNNGISRRSWANNDEAIFAIKREMKRTKNLKVTLPNSTNENIIKKIHFD